MPCLDEPSAFAFAHGRGDEGARAAIEAHLDGCGTCLALIAHAARLADGSADTDAVAISNAAPVDAGTTRYELGVEIARGGMGQILAAHDRVLDRAVAIKVVREDRPALAGRFEREVALTAKLQHPAIVPIHDSGQLPDGRRFYAMRRIGGVTLDRAIARCVDLRERLALLPHVIALVDAMAYVHSQRVIHRDLKPHNVLVGEFGETVLVDWGLAKRIGDRDDDREPAQPSDEAETQAGEIVGTRGYMAPEQARGEPVSPAADVYALGVTLAHLITGRPPPVARDLAADPDVRAAPADLVAIVIRALADDPSARYPTARELADDLHRFASGQLVIARDYSIAQLVWRWIVQHRALVAIATTAMLLVGGVATVSVVRIVAATSVAETERARAESSRDASHALIAFVLDKLLDELRTVGKPDLIEAAAREISAYYRRQIAENATDRDLEFAAKATSLLAQAFQRRGQRDLAISTLREAIGEARWAVIRHPSSARWFLLARADAAFGGLMVHGRPRDGIAALHEAYAIAQAQRDHAIDRANWSQLLADALKDLAKDASSRDDTAGAEQYLVEALTVARSVSHRNSDSEVRGIVAVATELAQLYMREGHWEKAHELAELVHDAAARAAPLHPFNPEFQEQLAVSWEVVGDVDQQEGQLDQAERAFGELHRVASALTVLDPRNLNWKNLLGGAEERLGELAQTRRHKADSLAHFVASRDISAQLAATTPDNSTLVNDLANCELMLGDAYIDFHELQLARGAYERAIALFDKLERVAASRDIQQSRGMAWIHVANLEHESGREPAALDAIDHGLPVLRAVLAADDTPFTRQLIGHALMLRADIAPAQAPALAREAAEVVAPIRDQVDSDVHLRELVDEIDRRRGAQSARQTGSPPTAQ